VTLHPDHQHNAVVIADLFWPIIKVKADAAFDSRMLAGRPLDGGTPIWKYIANILNPILLSSVVIGLGILVARRYFA
jgi:hypothetical protein